MNDFLNDSEGSHNLAYNDYIRYVNTHNDPKLGESFYEYNDRLDDMRRQIAARVAANRKNSLSVDGTSYGYGNNCIYNAVANYNLGADYTKSAKSSLDKFGLFQARPKVVNNRFFAGAYNSPNNSKRYDTLGFKLIGRTEDTHDQIKNGDLISTSWGEKGDNEWDREYSTPSQFAFYHALIAANDSGNENNQLYHYARGAQGDKSYIHNSRYDKEYEVLPGNHYRISHTPEEEANRRKFFDNSYAQWNRPDFNLSDYWQNNVVKPLPEAKLQQSPIFGNKCGGKLKKRK